MTSRVYGCFRDYCATTTLESPKQSFHLLLVALRVTFGNSAPQRAAFALSGTFLRFSNLIHGLSLTAHTLVIALRPLTIPDI